MGVKVLLLGVASALVACDAPAPRCALTSYASGDNYCNSATMLALRETESIHIDDDAVAGIYDTLAPAWRAFPATRLAQAWPWRASLPIWIDVRSSLPAIVNAWDVGRVETGDPAVDAVFLDHGVVAVTGKSTYGYTATLREPVNVAAYARLVATLPGTEMLDERYPSHGIDITLAWNGVGRIATFEIGWGDCFLGCIWRHTIVVSLPGDGTAVLLRAYGAELDATMLAQADAIAPP
ncbi:MAG: hypothetical protein K8W52_36640 [Deltaproteobacteria bacterium]|nr:hypothetical protein [Deltaproteobacteria bacterium]